MRIMVIDYREEERYLAETFLKGSGYEVVSAVNGSVGVVTISRLRK